MPQWAPPRRWQPPSSAESLPLGTVPCQRAHHRTWRQRRPPLRVPAQQTPPSTRLVDAPHGGLAAARPSTSPSRCHRVRRHRRPPRRLHRRHWRQARHRAQSYHRSPDHWSAGGHVRHRGATNPLQARQHERQGQHTAAIFMSIGMAGGVASASSTISRTGATASGRKGGVATRPQITTSSTWTIRRR